MGIFKFLLLLALLVACIVIGIVAHVDFRTFYIASQWAITEPARVYGENRGVLNGNFFYGPIFLVLFQPLTWFSYSPARVIWVGFQTLSFLTVLFFLYRNYLVLNKNFWAWLSVFILAISPVHNNFQSNNIQLMVLACLLLSEWMTRHRLQGVSFLGGSLCALLTVIKIYPGFIALYFFIVKNRATRLGLIVGGFFWLFFPFVYFGPEKGFYFTYDFLKHLGSYHGENSLLTKVEILCLPSLITRFFTPLGFEPKVISLIILVVSVASISSFFVWIWKTHHKVCPLTFSSAHFYLALAWMALVNPSSLVHYMVFYIPLTAEISVSLVQNFKFRKLFLIPFAIALFLIAFTSEGVWGKEWNNRFEFWNLPTLGFILLCIVGVARVVKYQRS